MPPTTVSDRATSLFRRLQQRREAGGLSDVTAGVSTHFFSCAAQRGEAPVSFHFPDGPAPTARRDGAAKDGAEQSNERCSVDSVEGETERTGSTTAARKTATQPINGNPSTGSDGRRLSSLALRHERRRWEQAGHLYLSDLPSAESASARELLLSGGAAAAATEAKWIRMIVSVLCAYQIPPAVTTATAKRKATMGASTSPLNATTDIEAEKEDARGKVKGTKGVPLVFKSAVGDGTGSVLVEETFTLTLSCERRHVMTFVPRCSTDRPSRAAPAPTCVRKARAVAGKDDDSQDEERERASPDLFAAAPPPLSSSTIMIAGSDDNCASAYATCCAHIQESEKAFLQGELADVIESLISFFSPNLDSSLHCRQGTGLTTAVTATTDGERIFEAETTASPTPRRASGAGKRSLIVPIYQVYVEASDTSRTRLSSLYPLTNALLAATLAGAAPSAPSTSAAVTPTEVNEAEQNAENASLPASCSSPPSLPLLTLSTFALQSLSFLSKLDSANAVASEKRAQALRVLHTCLQEATGGANITTGQVTKMVSLVTTLLHNASSGILTESEGETKAAHNTTSTSQKTTRLKFAATGAAGALVHCLKGVSRSASVVCVYFAFCLQNHFRYGRKAKRRDVLSPAPVASSDVRAAERKKENRIVDASNTTTLTQGAAKRENETSIRSGRATPYGGNAGYLATKRTTTLKCEKRADETVSMQPIAFLDLLDAVRRARPIVQPNVCFSIEMQSLWLRLMEEKTAG